MEIKQKLITVLIAAGLIYTGLMVVNVPAAGASSQSAHEKQVRRLYWVTLGREGDPGGVRSWTQGLLDGRSAQTTAWLMTRSREGRNKAAAAGGTTVENAYRWGLEREPDPGGLRSWSKVSERKALTGIANSKEHRTKVASRPQAAPAAANLEATPAHPNGWVNAGHGVYVPPVLIAIRHCESRGNYNAVNRSSGASGAYQFLRSSWANYGHKSRYGTSTAAAATPAQQDQAAVSTYQRSGTRPWNASKHCW